MQSSNTYFQGSLKVKVYDQIHVLRLLSNLYKIEIWPPLWH